MRHTPTSTQTGFVAFFLMWPNVFDVEFQYDHTSHCAWTQTAPLSRDRKA